MAVIVGKRCSGRQAGRGSQGHEEGESLQLSEGTGFSGPPLLCASEDPAATPVFLVFGGFIVERPCGAGKGLGLDCSWISAQRWTTRVSSQSGSLSPPAVNGHSNDQPHTTQKGHPLIRRGLWLERENTEASWQSAGELLVGASKFPVSKSGRFTWKLPWDLLETGRSKVWSGQVVSCRPRGRAASASLGERAAQKRQQCPAPVRGATESAAHPRPRCRGSLWVLWAGLAAASGKQGRQRGRKGGSPEDSWQPVPGVGNSV